MEGEEGAEGEEGLVAGSLAPLASRISAILEEAIVTAGTPAALRVSAAAPLASRSVTVPA